MRVEVELDEEEAAFVRGNVSSGRFASAADMLRAGVNMLSGKCSDADWTLAKLGRSLEEAENSGPPIPAEEVFAELRRRRSRKAA